MSLAEKIIEQFGEASRTLGLAGDELLVREGDESDNVYFVVSGSVTATISTPQSEIVVGRIGAGQIIGEVTVIAGGRRTATLRADGSAEVLEIHRSDFEAWLNDRVEIANEVSDQARERIDRTNVAAMVTEMLGITEPHLVQEVVDRVQWRRLEAGETLFRQEDEPDAAYFIVGGRLMVVAEDEDGIEQPLSELGRGEVVGELGLLDRAPRSATVRAVRDSTLAAFSTKTFEDLITKSPAMMLSVTRAILTRLREPERRRFGRAASLTIAVTARCDADLLVADIAAEVARFGTTRHLSSRSVDQILNRTNIAQASTDNVGVPRLAEFMHEADVGNDHVVLQTDRGMTGWTRRCLRQADRVVVVCSAHPDPTERTMIEAIFATLSDVGHVTTMLAVLHPTSADRPRGSARLVSSLNVDDLVHMREGSDADTQRLARLASGHGYGLVFSGGGARGFAHLGAFRALREAGVPIDQVAGCSMGAPMAAAVALGLEGEDLMALVERQFHKLLDYTVPIVSLIKGERITANIQESLGDWDIEDLWLPFYCVSTNLTKSRLEVHRRGNASRAVRASVAIPGVLPPVPNDGDLLVDGGVLNNMPFEPMRDDSMIETIIAVDVAPDQGPRARSDFGLSVSGLKALGASVRKGKSKYPSVTSVLLRSMLTGAVRNQKASMADGSIDLLLTMHLPGVGLLDFERAREVAAAGYESAAPDVHAWVNTRADLANPDGKTACSS